MRHAARPRLLPPSASRAVLRDMRRLAARGFGARLSVWAGRVGIKSRDVHIGAAGDADAIMAAFGVAIAHRAIQNAGYEWALDARHIDRAISVLGPDWPNKKDEDHDESESAAEENAPPPRAATGPDGTPEGEPQDASGAASPSGEGEDGAADTGVQGQHGTGPGGQQATNGGGDPDQARELGASDDPAQAGVAGLAQERESGQRSQSRAGDATSPGQGRTDSEAAPRESEQGAESEQADGSSATEDMPLEEEAEHGTLAAPSAAVRTEHGGDTADRLAALRMSKDAAREARKLARALERLARQWQVGAGQRPSPRIDARALVTELASRRVALSRCRREELEASRVLLLCDVSGSCSAASTATLAACYAVAQAMPAQVEVVVHSNGYTTADGAAKYDPGPRPIAGVVAFGDWDAADLYQALALRAPLVWLDSYTARLGVRRAPASYWREVVDWPSRPVRWYVGVNSAANAAEALGQK